MTVPGGDLEVPTRNVAINVGDTPILHLAAKIMSALGVPASSLSQIFETAFRAYQAGSREAAIAQMQTSPAASLKAGGRKDTRIDADLANAVKQECELSRAGRIGLGIILYDFTREEAEAWERGLNIHKGRPVKSAVTP